MAKLDNKHIKYIIAGAALVVLLVIVGAWLYIRSERQQMQSVQSELVDMEKQRMQQELDELAAQYQLQYEKLAATSGETSLSFDNDELLAQLESEQERVKQLSQELASVKASNAKRISELTGEINTLRALLRSYIVQIDSLHATNERLVAENQQVKEDYSRISNEASRLSQEKAALSDQVAIAARLDLSGLSVTPLDHRGKSTKRIDKMETLAVSFTIKKNVTAPVGTKAIYVRILNPNDMPMSGEGGAFSFEGQTLQATASKSIEYTGEDTPVTIYYQITQALLSGSYRADVFADGHRIGHTTFTL